MMDPALITSSLLVVLAALSIFHLQLRSIGSEPPLIKGRIPILGVAFEWFYEPGAFLESIRKRKGWIYTLYMAGRKMTVVSDPVIGITQVLTQGRVFNAPIFFAFLNKQLFGFSDATMDDNRFRDALNTKLVQLLSNKSKMSQIVELLTATYRGFVDETSGFCQREEVIDLYNFARYNMYTASATALFGPSFPIQKTFEPYIVFEENLLSYIRKVPRFLNPSGYNARDRTLEIIGQFFTDDEKVAKSSELVRELREVFQRPEYGYTRPEDFAGYFLSIVFASKSNSVPAAFWYIAHIVSDVELKTEVENIIAANYNKATGSFDWDELCRDELLVSCFKETARLVSNVTSGRYVTQDTILKVADPLNTGSDWKKSVKEYELHKGDSVLVIGNLIHWDPQAYPEPMRWIGKRFLEENKGKLVMHADEWRSYLPWGGGGHMCPGRHLALVEAVVQCVYILWYFDVEPIDKLPSMFIKHKYGTGVIRPDKPFNVTFKRRTIPLQ
ncbi:cytochrome P450 [Lipomyces doorenjongii]